VWQAAPGAHIAGSGRQPPHAGGRLVSHRAQGFLSRRVQGFSSPRVQGFKVMVGYFRFWGAKKGVSLPISRL
jgi:hypothetical protein